MLLNQTFILTPKIQALLNMLEGQRTAFALIPVHPEIVINFRRHSILGSALYSAKIEGIENNTDLDKLAIQNLVHTYTWLYGQKPDLNLTIDLVKTLHAKSLSNLRADFGHFRTEQSAIFNSAGIAIYLTPPPQDIEKLIESWLKQSTTTSNHPVIQTIIAHYQFEKIHPFLDGNGRVGRLIFTQLLRQHNYDFAGLLGLEEGIDQTRDDYYYHLQREGKNLTSFVEYFLTLLTARASSVLLKISKPQEAEKTSSLLPRRLELLNIIRDHEPCSFDFLHRRFVAIPPSTLRYDLLSLQKGKYIHKLGVTNGALYSSFPTE